MDGLLGILSLWTRYLQCLEDGITLYGLALDEPWMDRGGCHLVDIIFTGDEEFNSIKGISCGWAVVDFFSEMMKRD